MGYNVEFKTLLRNEMLSDIKKNIMTEEQTKIIFQYSFYFILIIVFIVIANKIYKQFASNGTSDYNNQLNTNNLTYEEYEYKQWADSLFRAFNGWGTDEDAVYRILNYLVTIDDWLKLIVKYGTDADKMKLPERLVYELSSSEQQKVNNILSKINANI